VLIDPSGFILRPILPHQSSFDRDEIQNGRPASVNRACARMVRKPRHFRPHLLVEIADPDRVRYSSLKPWMSAIGASLMGRLSLVSLVAFAFEVDC
jgi:hypothetical protein